MKIKNKIRTVLCKFLIPDTYKLVQEIQEIKNNYVTYGDLEEKEHDINYELGTDIEEAKQEALDEAGNIKDDLEWDISNLEDEINTLKEEVSDLKLEKSQLLTCIFKLAEKLDCEEEINKILRGEIYE